MQDVRLGGLQHANVLVQKGHAQAADFHLLAGSSLWGPGQLQQEVAAGCWHAVAASMPVLRQCILGKACCSIYPELLSLSGSAARVKVSSIAADCYSSCLS